MSDQKNERQTPVETTKVVSKCRACGKVDTFTVPSEGLRARTRGVKVREAFPGLPEERIQQLLRHTCPACQKEGEQGAGTEHS